MSAFGFSPDVTLDALFRRNALVRPEAYALIETSGRRYTYAHVMQASSDIAAQLAALGLPPKSSIVLCLPNSAELVFAILGVLRLGHVPVPMPVAWRSSDLVRACREAEAGVLITTAHYRADNLPLLAVKVAAEAFELSFPCAFGEALPDGIIPIELSGEPASAKSLASTARAASSGIATIQIEGSGVSFVQHRDTELLSAGLGAMIAADVQNADRIISAVSLTSFAGLATAFVPWLLSSGVITLLADSSAFVPPASARTHLIATAGSLWPIHDMLSTSFASATAVHFSGVATDLDFTSMQAERLVDAYAMRELAVISLRRNNAAEAEPIPLGPILAGKISATAPAIVETMLDAERKLLIRGPMVPTDRAQAGNWLATDIVTEVSGEDSFKLRGHEETISIGAMRFSLPDLERRILAVTYVSRVQVEEDEILGHRLVIESERPDVTSSALLEAGLPRVIANAVRKGEALKAHG